MSAEVRQLPYESDVIQTSTAKHGKLTVGTWVQIGYHCVEFDDGTKEYVEHHDLRPAEEASEAS